MTRSRAVVSAPNMSANAAISAASSGNVRPMPSSKANGERFLSRTPEELCEVRWIAARTALKRSGIEISESSIPRCAHPRETRSIIQAPKVSSSSIEPTSNDIVFNSGMFSSVWSASASTSWAVRAVHVPAARRQPGPSLESMRPNVRVGGVDKVRSLI